MTMDLLTRKPRRAIAESAIIACDGRGNGCVIWCAADGILASEIREVSPQLSDLGLDDAPKGISIWEGTWTWTPGGYECPQDGEIWPNGKFRVPTDAEWLAIREGRGL